MPLLLWANSAKSEPTPLPFRSREPFVPVIDLFGGAKQGLVLAAEEAESGRPAPITIGNTTFYPEVRRAGMLYGGYTSIRGDLQVVAGDIYLGSQGIGTALQQLQMNDANQQGQIEQQQGSLNGLGTTTAQTQQALGQLSQTVDSLGQVSAQQTTTLLENATTINGLALQMNDAQQAINRLDQNINNLGSGMAGATALAAALASLPNDSGDRPLACGIGSGGYSERYALAMGCSINLSTSLSLNAGGAYLFGGGSSYGNGTLSNLAGQFGVSYRFGSRSQSSARAGANSQALINDLRQLKEDNGALRALITELRARVDVLQTTARHP